MTPFAERMAVVRDGFGTVIDSAEPSDALQA